MSQVFVPSSGGVVTPVSILNGGTGQTAAENALAALSTPGFSLSGQDVNWGSTTVDSPILPAELDNVADVVDQLILALNALGVLG